MSHLSSIRPFRLLVVLAVIASALVTAVAPASAEEEVLSFPTPEDFVTQQYQDFLARNPDRGGLTFWSDQIRRGVDPGRLVEILVSTKEFGSTVAPVVRLYEAHFQRSPDFEGLQFWSGRHRAGLSLVSISSFFAQSDEFEATYGTLSDSAFIDLVYRNVLDRAPDSGGRNFWLGQLRNGLSRGALMANFSESPEYVKSTDGRVKATMLYLGMLRRSPDGSGLAFWSSYIGGNPYRNAINGFLRSPEYSERTRAFFPAVHPLTGEAARGAQNRAALVLKIDNHNRARPQVGLNQADLVWEELVEGSITRFAAVFHEQTPSIVGPTRSARTGDIDLVSQLNTPLFGASGANQGVLAALRGAPLVNVNAIEVGSAYFRQSGRSAPHNLMARTTSLWAVEPDRAGLPPLLFRYRGVGAAAAGSRAAGVDIDFGNTEVTYRWNGRGWVRTQDGRNHVDSAGVVVAPPNVIVQVTNYGTSSADAESPEAITVGSGTAYVYTGGNMIQATWSRAEATHRIIYRDSAGNEILLAPGRTWVAIAPPGTVTLR